MARNWNSRRRSIVGPRRTRRRSRSSAPAAEVLRPDLVRPGLDALGDGAGGATRGGSGTHACQQYTSPSAHDASSARTRLRLTFEAEGEEVSGAEEVPRKSPHAAAARTAAFASSPSATNAAPTRARHSPNVISTSSSTSSPTSSDDDLIPFRGSGVPGAGNTMRPNHALCCPSKRESSDISCVGTAMARATSPSGYHARAPSPSITSTASRGRIGWRPPRVRPRDDDAPSSASFNPPSSPRGSTRSAGVITTATPTSVCSPFPRRPGRSFAASCGSGAEDDTSSSRAAAGSLPAASTPAAPFLR